METNKQSKCSLWYRMRAGGITSSNAHNVCNTNMNTPSMSLLSKICYTSQRTIPNNAMDWGSKHEYHAKQAYTNLMSKTHTGFKVLQCGFIMNPSYPCLGASPDGKISCDCCGEGCIEIKCPYTMRLSSTLDVPYIVNNELSKKHSYYYQIQMHLLICNYNFCDFVVWAPYTQLFVQRIFVDKEVQNKIIEKATAYHMLIVMPEICFKHFSAKRKVELSTIAEIRRCDIDLKETTVQSEVDKENVDLNNNSNVETFCICKEPDDGSQMIMCDNEKCCTKWFHVRCLSIKRVPKGSWFCDECKP